MTKEQKNEVIELLKGKFSQYNNFYVTDTESLTVEQVGKLRRACFNKQVEMKVAKNIIGLMMLMKPPETSATLCPLAWRLSTRSWAPLVSLISF